MHRINHAVAFNLDGACTNQGESYFAQLRGAEIGQHHHISDTYSGVYTGEMPWKEDYRGAANGDEHRATTAALADPVSLVWCGYWNR